VLSILIRIIGISSASPKNTGNGGTCSSFFDGPDGIACWFVNTNYNEASFFVRQA
jgi:hypothetical protein